MSASLPGGWTGRPLRPLSAGLAELRRLPGQVADLFRFAAIRLWAKRRLFIGLQIGVIVAATVAAVVPLYSNGALTRLLAASLQPQNERPAGAMLLRYLYNQGDLFTPTQEGRLARLASSIGRTTGLGTTPPAFFAQSGSSSFLPDAHSPVPEDATYQRNGELDMEVGLPQHVKIIAGRMYSDAVHRGVIDAVISQSTQQNLHMIVGQVWDFPSPVSLGPPVRVRVVGVYSRLNPGGPFWPYQYQDQDLFISPTVFLSRFMYNSSYPLEEASWYSILRLNGLAPSAAAKLIGTLTRINAEAGQIMPHTQLAISPVQELLSFGDQLSVMQIELLLISLPILALTFYYVVMTAGLAIQQERNEISVLVSRGSRTWQIVSLYLAEWLIMGAVAFVVAPFLASVLTEVVGASSSFFVFVNRAAIPILPSASMYLFEAGAVVAALLAALLPVVAAARQSIVDYRQQSARASRAPFWRRAYLDLVLAAIAAYEWHQFQAGNAQGASGASALTAQPLLYLVPAVFLAAAGLFFVRILPWAIRGVDALVGRLAPLWLVLPARQMARAPTQFSPLIFLLVFTVGLGYYSAAAARTLNRNLSDNLAYQVGSDVSMYEVWAPPGGAQLGSTASAAGLETGGLQQFGGVTQGQPASSAAVGALVEEPPFAPNQHLPGVVSAARVFLEQVDLVIGGQSYGGQQGQLMAIDPVNFFQTAWWRPDLSPYSFLSYMNALLSHYNGVLVQQSFMNDSGLQPGDTLQLGLNGVNGSFEVLGPIRYWPGMYPDNGPLLVANWPYVENTYGVEPYYVWFKTKASASDQTMVNDLQNHKLFPTQVTDRRALLGQAHANPQWTGSNGLLTISFLTAALLTVLGYLLYAILALRMRQLQFGLLRAMGMARSALGSSVAVEQAFLLIVGVAAGLYVGDWSAHLFLPFFQAANGSSVPTFIIMGPGPDLIRMGLIMGVLLLTAVLGLLQSLRGMRIGEAVKLGEE